MLCCLLGHKPGKTEITGLWHTGPLDEAQSHMELKAWCLRCGVHYRTKIQLQPAAQLAIEHSTFELRAQLAKLSNDGHQARQEVAALRAKIAGAFEDIKFGTLEDQERLKIRLDEYFK